MNFPLYIHFCHDRKYPQIRVVTAQFECSHYITKLPAPATVFQIDRYLDLNQYEQGCIIMRNV